MSKRPPKKLRRDERKRCSHLVSAMHAASKPMRMTESEFETYVASLTPEELAVLLLAQFSSGITLGALVPAVSVALATAEGNGEAPAPVALHLLTMRELPAEARALIMPDPDLRAELDAFFNFAGTDIEAFLPDFVDVNDDEEVVAGIKHMLRKHRAYLLGEVIRAGDPGMAGCVRDLHARVA